MNIYFHVCLINDGLLIAIELLHSLSMSSLLYQSKSVNIGIKYKSENDLEQFKKILHGYNLSGNINILYEEDNDLNNDYELSTAIHFKNYADSLVDSDEYVLFFHTKCVSYFNKPSENPCRFWRKYMDYFMIQNWKSCISVMDSGYESCGTHGLDIKVMDSFLNINNNHSYLKYYPGTFFWMNTSLIKRIPIEYFYKDNPYGRWSIEALPGLIQHRQYIFSLPVPHNMDLYKTVLHPLQYNR